MKVNLHAICFATALGAIVLPAAPLHAQSQAPAGNVENGQKAYVTVGCYQCHGRAGHGGGAAGPAVAKTKLPFDAFLMQVRKPSNQMPPYEAPILTDQLAADIYAFVQTLPDPVDMSKVTLPR